MFARLTEFCGRRAPLVVLVWVGAAVWLTLALPPLSALGADKAAFLPKEARTRQAQDVLRRAFPGDPALDPAVVVVTRDSGLVEGDRAYLRAFVEFLASPAASGHVRAVQSAETSPELAPVLRAQDGKAELVILTLKAGPLTDGAGRALEFVRRHLDNTAPPGLHHRVTGLTALFSAEANVLKHGLGGTALAAVALVLVVLVLVYRSLVAPLLSLISIGVAFLVARGLVAIAAQRGVQVASLGETWMVLVTFGAGTDYCLFVISRYRAELGAPGGRGPALRRAGNAVGPVISASAATVVLGVLSFLAARVLIVRTTGPVFAIGVATVLAAGLTLTPALLRLAGRHAFWPATVRTEEPSRRWVRMAALVERRPGPVLAGGLLLLLVPSAGLLPMRQAYDLVRELPRSTEARQGFEVIATHYPSGAVSPLYLVVERNRPLTDDAAI
ncbi:MAG TPA: MMPL family transporter, partial [Acidimicrobiia bacterium]|nr:MMPL family transporter [Acidimicrobiia bacterium]